MTWKKLKIRLMRKKKRQVEEDKKKDGATESGKRDMFQDPREVKKQQEEAERMAKEADTMDDWDQAKLESVVAKKFKNPVRAPLWCGGAAGCASEARSATHFEACRPWVSASS